MGIPREMMQKESNFLYQPQSKLGPGEYNPEVPKNNPNTSYFGKDSGRGPA